MKYVIRVGWCRKMKYEIIIIIILSFQLHSDETTNNIYCTHKDKFNKLLKSIVISKGGAKSGFSDMRVSVTQLPMYQKTWTFACRGLLWVSIENNAKDEYPDKIVITLVLSKYGAKF